MFAGAWRAHFFYGLRVDCRQKSKEHSVSNQDLVEMHDLTIEGENHFPALYEYSNREIQETIKTQKQFYEFVRFDFVFSFFFWSFVL